VLLEANGYEPWLCDLIQETGLNVKLAHPLKTRAIAEEKIMTDKLSSSVLADLLRANLVSEAYIASPKIRQERYHMRYRQGLVHLRTAAKNKIHNLLGRLGLNLPDITDLFGKSGRAYLKQLRLEHISLREILIIIILDIIKKFASEGGRIYGSLKNLTIYI